MATLLEVLLDVLIHHLLLDVVVGDAGRALKAKGIAASACNVGRAGAAPLQPLTFPAACGGVDPAGSRPLARKMSLTILFSRYGPQSSPLACILCSSWKATSRDPWLYLRSMSRAKTSPIRTMASLGCTSSGTCGKGSHRVGWHKGQRGPRGGRAHLAKQLHGGSLGLIRVGWQQPPDLDKSLAQLDPVAQRCQGQVPVRAVPLRATRGWTEVSLSHRPDSGSEPRDTCLLAFSSQVWDSRIAWSPLS